MKYITYFYFINNMFKRMLPMHFKSTAYIRKTFFANFCSLVLYYKTLLAVLKTLN